MSSAGQPATTTTKRPLIHSPRRCGSWFCGHCQKVKGRKLERRLVEVIRKFERIQLVTLTIDPALFSGPEAAYVYFRQHRCVALLVQDLRRGRYLLSDEYFYVLEFQDGWFHVHLLFNARHIPWAALMRFWSKHRPPDAGVPCDSRPAFGTVRVSDFPDHDPGRAAGYVLKTFTDPPSEGFPAWVLTGECGISVRRYGTSRQFWGDAHKHKTKRRSRTTGPKSENTRRSHRERIASCGTAHNIYRSVEVIDPNTGEIRLRYKWIAQDYARKITQEGIMNYELLARVPLDKVPGVPANTPAWLHRQLELPDGGLLPGDRLRLIHDDHVEMFVVRGRQLTSTLSGDLPLLSWAIYLEMDEPFTAVAELQASVADKLARGWRVYDAA